MNIVLSCIESKIVHSTKFYGRFALSPFSKGQGLTVANTLRRSLLSQLPGTAITFVHIQNTHHEYANMVGVRESVLDILLNLKQITMVSDFEVFTPQILFLNIQGPKVVYAKDLKLPFFISLVDPHQYITTLTEKGQLRMKLLVQCGKGYNLMKPGSKQFQQSLSLLKQRITPKTYYRAPLYEQWKTQQINTMMKIKSGVLEKETIYKSATSEKHQKPPMYLKPKKEPIRSTFKPSAKDFSQTNAFTDQIHKEAHSLAKPVVRENVSSLTKKKGAAPVRAPAGYFPVDSLFSPITKVNYRIEENLTTGETVHLEIWTNGTVDPRNAIHQASQSIIDLFLPLQMTRRPISFLPSYNQKKYDASSCFLNKTLKPARNVQGSKLTRNAFFDTLKQKQNLHQLTELMTQRNPEINRLLKTRLFENTVENGLITFASKLKETQDANLIRFILSSNNLSSTFVPPTGSPPTKSKPRVRLKSSFLKSKTFHMLSQTKEKTSSKNRKSSVLNSLKAREELLSIIQTRGLNRQGQMFFRSDIMNLNLTTDSYRVLKNYNVQFISQLILIPTVILKSLPFEKEDAVKTIKQALNDYLKCLPKFWKRVKKPQKKTLQGKNQKTT